MTGFARPDAKRLQKYDMSRNIEKKGEQDALEELFPNDGHTRRLVF